MVGMTKPNSGPMVATSEIRLPDGAPINLEVSPTGRKSQRLIVAIRGDIQHRDGINTDSSVSRERFLRKLASKIEIDCDVLVPLVEPQIVNLATEIDETCSALTDRDHDHCDADSQATLAANMASDWELVAFPSKGSLRDHSRGKPQGKLVHSLEDIQTIPRQAVFRCTKHGH